MTMIPKVCINCRHLKEDGSCKIHRFLIPVLCPDFEVRKDLEVDG